MEKKTEVKAKEDVKPVEKGFVAYAEFKFRKKFYKVGDVFVPPSDVFPDPNLDEFRRMNSKKNKARIGHTFYFEVPGLNPDADTQVSRVILPVE